jgi:hypothetical protein
VRFAGTFASNCVLKKANDEKITAYGCSEPESFSPAHIQRAVIAGAFGGGSCLILIDESHSRVVFESAPQRTGGAFIGIA